MGTRAKIAASHHQPFHASPLWILLIVGIGITVYGLLFLWVLGSDGKRQEWKISEGRIFNREGQELRPTFVRDRSEYNQTDAFNGYSHYFLELHSDTELLATNSYNSKDDFRRDAGQVRELTNARQLDLVWSYRVEESGWSPNFLTSGLFFCVGLWTGYRRKTEIGGADGCTRILRIV